MNRVEAVALLAERNLAHLTSEARCTILLDWWSIDGDDAEYANLPNDLKLKLATLDEAHDPADSIYDPLLLLSLRHLMIGVVNRYLEERLEHLGIRVKVTGDVEALEPCPCCHYRNLSEKGGYEICRVCFWEDDGTCDLDAGSGPNHMTLREGRANYHRLGAVSESALPHVLTDGRSRYVCDTLDDLKTRG